MSKDSSITDRARPGYGVDRVIGGIMMCFGLGALAISVINLQSISHFPMPSDLIEAGLTTALSQMNGRTSVFWTLVLIMSILKIACGFLVFRGKRKGMVFVFAVEGLSALVSGAGIIVNGATAFYLYLRLWGTLGPRPK